MQKAILLVLVVLFAVCYAQKAKAPKLRISCNKFCLARNLDAGESTKRLQRCIQGCMRSKIGRDDTAKLLTKLQKVVAVLAKDVQQEEAVLSNSTTVEKKADEVMSDAVAPAPGATLVTTDAVNARDAPCTTAKKITTAPSGTQVKYQGKAQSGCGYTWYYVSGSFGNAWMASNYLREQGGGGGGGGGCRTRNYPVFKQCDSRWGSNGLGSSSTVCKVGCLMSSVSMAMNGLGKRINGQESNPGTLNAYLKGHGGYYGNLFVWGSVKPFGLNYIGQTSDKAALRNYICQNKVVILNVNNGGHWVLATGHDGSGTFYVNDSGYNRSSYSAGEVGVAGVFDV